ncbi:membrane protein insertion efficiency factor YidD [Spongisporangium articulatum]|uniref:Putative membrane protein insertion efficiency factor n=1 Tax=Spongisporangium articulatum TaxID=3362603 RepID=A0ABW8AI35_9ACTN
MTRLPRLVIVGLLHVYRAVVSPWYGPTCRFYPSCSEYALIAVGRHGVFKGTALAVWRLLRCNPWNLGGVDLVPPVRARGREHLEADPGHDHQSCPGLHPEPHPVPSERRAA